MKGLLNGLVKLAVTLAIFAGIFVEFGGGYAPVDVATLRSPGTFETANPAYPGIVGRMQATLRGRSLPPPRLETTLEHVCLDASEQSVFVRTTTGGVVRFKPIRHCRDGGFTRVYRQEG